MKIEEQISKRRTFGIISHPDAGKTTLTEKLLLFGGAIQTAGAVKSNKIKKSATSDFMEIEKQRGISVATSVMGFEYDGYKINILDTPGHKDFAEDTYRTLTAVDSVILVIDSVKGVEEQTRKLMEVCRMRHTPVIIFINKLDREGQDPFELLDEIEKELDIHVRPLTWPIGMGKNFKGVFNIHESKLQLFESEKSKQSDSLVEITDIDSATLDEHIGDSDASKLREDLELVSGVYEEYDDGLYKDGFLAPVFFGSAINNFGVKELLETFVSIANEPMPRVADKRTVQPEENKFTGFIFKIHANLDPNHRDRIAFCRIVSGTFERNVYYNHARLRKKLRFSNPTSFMANDKNIVEQAFPGDVVGLYDTCNFKIGDTLTEGEILQYKGIPSFSPEIFRQLVNRDPFKSKQLDKGIRQLTDEGVAQLFVRDEGNIKIIGTVGELQFEVIKFRLLNEYGAACDFQHLNFYKACWITSENKKELEEFVRRYSRLITRDKDGRFVYMAENAWMLEDLQKSFSHIEFHFTSEFKTDNKSSIGTNTDNISSRRDVA
ncbi:MAG: peptide chain release factor 3 [Candidatus Dadabacteria bacterium]|nr:peptide chain release factor 3 [Candidatus Dadabacteria bacterium]NIS08712.1 peptide chain release factor 3 [Candidatus Dadabacteria bacterium]NIV42194.1 peptide chain release factor 3 [Candidatus Dadabacteria bacterium]NIX15398.1 peptide chain release factor 3 [Candidatus Dadabacteria bacterium]NIY22061.1 peptide chain release factor 3 [Candidatus Dadabacteria bacterium]